jgi:surface antigen
MRKAIVAAFAAALLVAACASGNGTVTGTVPGANPGIVLNSPVGTGADQPELGAVEGGLIGADVGRSLDARDREIALQAEYEALEYCRPGQPTNWTSRSGNRGEVQVGSSYQVNRLDCREYTHNVYVGGRLRVVRGTACRQPDGVWRVVG